jgi:hypothetical protein
VATDVLGLHVRLDQYAGHLRIATRGDLVACIG